MIKVNVGSSEILCPEEGGEMSVPRKVLLIA